MPQTQEGTYHYMEQLQELTKKFKVRYHLFIWRILMRSKFTVIPE